MRIFYFVSLFIYTDISMKWKTIFSTVKSLEAKTFLEHKAGIATSPVERENIKKEDMVK